MIISRELLYTLNCIEGKALQIMNEASDCRVDSDNIKELKKCCEEFLWNEQIKHINMLPKQKR